MDPHMFSGREKNETRLLPMMPIRDVVIFPHMMTPFVVGRESSIRALEEALAGDKKIFLATQHDAAVDEPKPNEIYQVGTIASIIQSLKLPDGNIKVLVEGVERGKILKMSNEEGHFRVNVQTKQFRPVTTPSLEQLVQRATSLFEQYVKLSQSLNYETMIAAVKVDEIGKFTDTIAANLNVSIEEKQELLEIFDPVDRLTRLADILEIEIEKLNVDRTIQGRVKRQMERAQREYYLNEKIKAIQKELGRNEKSEIDELKKKIEAAGMTKDALDHAMAELKRLEMMPPMSAESTVSRNYLDWLLAVPWKKKSKEIRDITRAQKVLEEDHYGLEKIKERILEFLAVRQLVKNPRGSILCLVGPPGVGKTSLGRSIARATGRKFVRLSLGGVRDEAEIRGHRRTYIGALPGQIIQMMKKAGTVNPIFLLDEVDKMSMDFRGDPSAALLEVLDPEQNSTGLSAQSSDPVSRPAADRGPVRSSRRPADSGILLASQVSYDAANRKLQLAGYLSAADQATLNGLSADGPYLTAVAQLFQSRAGGRAAPRPTSSSPRRTVSSRTCAVSSRRRSPSVTSSS